MPTRIKSSIPVLIIGYARFENIARQIKVIRSYTQGKIYIHLDGGQNQSLRSSQRDFALVLESQYWNVKLLKREQNLGVALGVISAIDWFFCQESSGIIIEDDLVFNAASLEFLEMGLTHISGIAKSLMVTGCTFSRGGIVTAKLECKWTSIPLIWGWATTIDKWKKIRDLIIDCQLPAPKDFISSPRAFFQSGRIKALSGEVDTWDSPLAYMMYTKGFLCLVPPVNYFSNIGNDKHAVHTTDSKFPMFMPISDTAPQSRWFVPPRLYEVTNANKHYIEELFEVKKRNLFGLLRMLFLVPRIGRLKARIES